VPEPTIAVGQTLAKVPNFCGLTEGELSFLAQRTVTRNYSAGQLENTNATRVFEKLGIHYCFGRNLGNIEQETDDAQACPRCGYNYGSREHYFR
jgi:hypothetical protein